MQPRADIVCWVEMTQAQHSDPPPLEVLLLPPQNWTYDNRLDRRPDFEQLFRSMADAGVRTQIVSPNRWPWNPLDGRHPLLQGIDPLRAMRAILAQRRFDAVLTIYESPALPLVMARRAGLFRLPVIMTDLIVNSKWALREWMHRQLLRHLDGIIVLGSNQIEAIRALGATDTPIRFVPQHIDTAFWQPVGIDRPAVVLTVGDDAGRDYTTLLEATRDRRWPILAKTKMIADPPPHVTLLRERLDWVDYRDMFQRALCVAIPLSMKHSASGLTALLEAMALGMPIVVSDSPGLRDYAIPGETALVVPVGDAAAFRAALDRLMTDDALRRRLGEGARRFIERHCSYAAAGAAQAAFIREVVARHSGGRAHRVA